jgi:predicted enzyme related to lactoylglutathione lyase
MRRLLHLVNFTADLEQSKQFYRHGLGLEVAADTPFMVDFSSEGVGLILLALSPQQKREVELCFESPQIEETVQRLRSRGVQFVDELRHLSFGSVIHFRDPEGNLISLLRPAEDVAPRPEGAEQGNGHDASPDTGTPGVDLPAATSPRLSTAIVNARDITGMRAFYRDNLGLHVTVDSPWWVEFDAGRVALALHPWVRRPEAEHHHTQPVSLGFVVPDIDDWVEEARSRGVTFLGAPTDSGFGLQAEAVDPEGSVIVIREPLPEDSLEERLAEEFEDDEVPHQTAIRKPLRKGVHAVSRVAIRPEYKPARGNGVVKRSTAEKQNGSSSGPGGNGRSSERERSRPAIGRQQKATSRSLAEQKRAVAKVSRSKPVKRASATKARARGH